MYQFLVENSVFVVMIIVLIIWLGISLFLLALDRKLSKIEKKLGLTESQNQKNK